MKLNEIINVMKYLGDETSLSDKELYRYDMNKDGVVDYEDLILVFETFAKDTTQTKNQTGGLQFKKQIRKLLKSGKFSDNQVNYIGQKISEISENHIVEIRNTDNMVKTEKGKRTIIK